MSEPKQGKSRKGAVMHYSAGAVIKKGGKYLLIDRAIPPFGFAGPAGHVDEGEDAEESVKREVEEETGLVVTNLKPLFEEELDWNWCSKGITVHFWHLFECEVSGELKMNSDEAKSAGWFEPGEMKKLKLEPVWEYWFKKLGVI